MDHGKDISQKIRSAIKAKLIELNAYVDDELPDYIMVMIANKKSQKQMTDDLSLFLGNNTEKFTSWLHSLLTKLQTLGSDQQKSKEIEKLKGEASREGDSAKKVTTDGKEKSSKRHSTEKKEKVREKSSDKSKEKSKEAQTKTNKESQTKTKEEKQIKVEPEDEVVELLANKGEDDEFTAEYKEEPVQKKVKGSSFSRVDKIPKTQPQQDEHSTDTKARSVQSDLSHSRPRSNARPGSVHSRLGLPLTSSKDDRAAIRPSSSVRSVQRVSSTSKRTVSPPKRKQPLSVVASVKKKYEEEDEEEYDPYNPAVGSVASVIRVSSRKSSVPLGKQANKNLILKATAEAEKSVNSKMDFVLKDEKLYSAKETRPAHERLKNSVTSQRAAHERLKTPVTVTLHGKSSARSQTTREPLLNPVKGLISKSKQTECQIARELPVNPVKGLVSKSKQMEIKTMMYTVQNKPKAVTKMSTQRVKPQVVDDDNTAPALDSRQVESKQAIVDSRLIQIHDDKESQASYEEDDSLKSEENFSESSLQFQVESDDASNPDASPEIDPEVHQILQQEEQDLDCQDTVEEVESHVESEESIPEELSEDKEETTLVAEIDEDDDEAQRQELLKQQNIRQLKKRAHSQTKMNEKPTALVAPVDTRFIVTLDGIHPQQFKEEKDAVIENDTPSGMDSGVSTPITQKMPFKKIPEIKPITFSLKDTDDEEEEEELPSKVAKMSERCRFWPACVNGNACSYHHPTIPCKMFPKCKYGEKCLYIHPNCKYDSKCTRKDCPFTHASKRSNVTTVIQKIVQVPFQSVPIAATYNPSQPFFGASSKPLGGSAVICRFFPNCHNVQCTFQHPKPCRFGVKCMNKAQCSFYHPQMPSKSQLTWTANKQGTHISQREFDAGKADSLPTSAK